jgi:hypothetical protein
MKLNLAIVILSIISITGCKSFNNYINNSGDDQQKLTLDNAILFSSNMISENYQDNTRLAIVNINSESKNLSEYILGPVHTTWNQ